MTRETKIGLLVGLAFIIVVGILLSDHMAATTELPQAPLETAERSGHGAVVAPGETHSTEIARVITPNDVVPPAPVPTREELTARPPTGTIVIGGPTASNYNNAGPAVDPNRAAPTPGPSAYEQARAAELARAAAEHGETLVDGSNRTIPLPDNNNNTVRPTPPPAAGPKMYVAQSGDNLNKIALKAMGSSTKATRDAILKANPKLAANPDMIIAGQSYVIPSAPAPAPAAPTGVAVLPLPTPRVPEKPADKPDTRTASANPAYFYTVKENDNLWHIAQEQLGNGSAYTAIKELNKDTLKGTDAVRVGMKLRLPAKPLAMAN